ncbi:ubiquitin carboxyl-terminal hydrolase 23-like isoform X3 [Phragmites australis]|uniref:ubiquitin carboxyl-terminal hydrolase 23-like isoform X3 n=1 Tax=Phragmites australis TaxID=29695 RepID=UPI002D778563|nr:ubiquitin carboxyl-terminal hydrolase 23-like isoform X3 [Phragmites australis]
MGESGAEGLMHRRIEFHAATKPRAAAAVDVPGGFRMERLFAGADKRVAAAAAARSDGEGRRLEKWESSGSGFDPELSAARIYLRRIGAGLHNLGNTCYLNSVLQCLTYTEPFVAYLQSGKHKSSCRTAGFCALCALQNHVKCALQSTGKILTPMQFIKNLRCISHSFHNYRQEDAHELMVNLLELMHKCCLPSGIPSESPSAYEKSLVHRIFGGRLRSQVRCTRCSHCSNKFDPFLDLSLEIGNAATLMKALENFTEEELLDGGEKHYNCQHCKQKVVAKKRFTIDKAPSVLTIHLKRFSPFNPLQKIDKKVDFQTTLNLKPFVSNSEGMDLKYSLYGVLVHAGWNTQSGHYYCFVRTSSGIWHNLDDNQVRQVREGDVLRQKAYMLFYVRDRVRSSVIHRDNGVYSLPDKKMIPEKIAFMDGAIRNGLVETALNACSFTNEDTKLQKQNPDNGHPSNFCNALQDQCSNAYSKTEVIEASTSQNNEPASVQQALCPHPDGAATLFTKTNQITSDSQREPDACILHDASCDQKTCEKTLRDLQLKSDGSLTDSGKDIAAVSFPICNGSDGLLGANNQATEPQTDPFCKPTSDSDTVTIAQIIPTEDTAVSNETVSTHEDSTSGNEAKETEPIKQHDEVAVVKERSVKIIDEKENADEQASLPNKLEDGQALVKKLSVMDTDRTADAEEQASVPNKLEDGQALVKELSVMDTDHMADAEEQALVKELSVMDTDHMAGADEQISVQNNLLDIGQVNSENKISEDSAQVVCSEDCAQAMCSEDSVQVLDKYPCHGNLHKNMKIKSKKHVKYPVVNLFFGSKQLLLASLKVRKKRKQRRTKKQSRSSMDIESIANDQQTSTSETVLTSGISCKSYRRKRSHNTASSEDGAQIFYKKQNLGDSISAADRTMDKKDSKDATLASAELASSCPSSVANADSGKCTYTNENVSWHFNLLTRGLREITVPRWDDNDMPNTTAKELQYLSSTSIGYVLDEWNEEYDRGRRKVRKSKGDFSGPNPFQETASIRSRPRMRLKADQARSGNQPLRI